MISRPSSCLVVIRWPCFWKGWRIFILIIAFFFFTFWTDHWSCYWKGWRILIWINLFFSLPLPFTFWFFLVPSNHWVPYNICGGSTSQVVSSRDGHVPSDLHPQEPDWSKQIEAQDNETPCSHRFELYSASDFRCLCLSKGHLDTQEDRNQTSKSTRSTSWATAVPYWLECPFRLLFNPNSPAVKQTRQKDSCGQAGMAAEEPWKGRQTKRSQA